MRKGSGNQSLLSTEVERRYYALIEATGQIVWSWSPTFGGRDVIGKPGRESLPEIEGQG